MTIFFSLLTEDYIPFFLLIGMLWVRFGTFFELSTGLLSFLSFLLRLAAWM